MPEPYGPSEAAVRNVEDLLHGALGEPDNEEAHADLAWKVADELHDPALGLDASVNMGQIIARIKRMGVRSPDLIAQTLEAEAAERANRARANAR